MIKRNIALTFVAVVCMFLVPYVINAAPNIKLNVSANQVVQGAEITISGTTTEMNNVLVKVISPRSSIFYMDVVPVFSGTFSVKLTVPKDETIAPLGNYKVIAGSSTTNAEAQFKLVTTSGGGNYTNDLTSIPFNAGKFDREVIIPERNQLSDYWAGELSFNQALDSATDTITVQLPGEARDRNPVLELPLRSWFVMESRDISLQIQVGQLQFLVPPKAIKMEAEKNGKLRINIRQLWDDEAILLAQEIRENDQAFYPANVIFSISLEIVHGSVVTPVSQLQFPITVTLQLTMEQMQKLTPNLTGLYKKTEEGVRYAGRTDGNGIVKVQLDQSAIYFLFEYRKNFEDMKGHWAENTVQSMAAMQIVSGISASQFAPERQVKRAEFITLIIRALETKNVELTSSEQSFKDIEKGKFYTDAVAKAYGLGLVQGFGGYFRPDDPVTREEAAAILVRAAPYFKIQKTEHGLPAFTDADKISEWARQTVNEAWSLGLIKGDGVRYNPHRETKRAEAASMIARLLVTDNSER